MRPFVVKNKEAEEYWSNIHGWTDISEATRFTENEAKEYNLPTDGEWVSLWEVNSIQFARFIAECEACGVFSDEHKLVQVSDEMDLSLEEVYSIVSRAQESWDAYKAAISNDDLPYTLCELCDHFVEELHFDNRTFCVHIEDGDQDFTHRAKKSSLTKPLSVWKVARPDLFKLHEDGAIGPNSKHHSRRGKNN